MLFLTYSAANLLNKGSVGFQFCQSYLQLDNMRLSFQVCHRQNGVLLLDGLKLLLGPSETLLELSLVFCLSYGRITSSRRNKCTVCSGVEGARSAKQVGYQLRCGLGCLLRSVLLVFYPFAVGHVVYLAKHYR